MGLLLFATEGFLKSQSDLYIMRNINELMPGNAVAYPPHRTGSLRIKEIAGEYVILHGYKGLHPILKHDLSSNYAVQIIASITIIFSSKNL